MHSSLVWSLISYINCSETHGEFLGENTGSNVFLVAIMAGEIMDVSFRFSRNFKYLVVLCGTGNRIKNLKIKHLTGDK